MLIFSSITYEDPPLNPLGLFGFPLLFPWTVGGSFLLVNFEITENLKRVTSRDVKFLLTLVQLFSVLYVYIHCVHTYRTGNDTFDRTPLKV